MTPEDHAWIAAAVGEVLSARPLEQPGTSREIWVVDVRTGEGVLPTILRKETGFGPWAGTGFTLRREADLLLSLAGAPIPVPRCYAANADGTAVLMERLPGRASLQWQPDDDKPAVMRSFVARLAALHAFDVTTVDLPIPVPATAPDHALLDLADYVEPCRRLCPRNDHFEVAVEWLQANAPTTVERTSLCHGDAGPGNFMHDGRRCTGLIDLEMAHVGEPTDDLAWLWLRTQLLSTDPDFPRYLAWYEEESGRPVDRDRLAYYRILVILRCAAANLLISTHGITGPRNGLERVLGWLRSALADAGGPRLEPVVAIPDLPTAWSPS